MDISTQWFDEFAAGDYRVSGGDLLPENGLKTAVLISLFTNARALPDDVLPSMDSTRGGWWGDAFMQRQLGSKLWLLVREKRQPETLRRAEEYALAALHWLIDDEIAKGIEAHASYPAEGILFLHIVIKKPDGSSAGFRFHNLWSFIAEAGDAIQPGDDGMDNGFYYNGAVPFDGSHVYG